MSRNTTDAQKRVWDFRKSDTLAQTNQIKYGCVFMHGTKNIKKLFSKSNITKKKREQVFLDFILFFNIIVEKLGKKNNLVKLELSKEIFLSPEYPDFRLKF